MSVTVMMRTKERHFLEKHLQTILTWLLHPTLLIQSLVQVWFVSQCMAMKIRLVHSVCRHWYPFQSKLLRLDLQVPLMLV